MKTYNYKMTHFSILTSQYSLLLSVLCSLFSVLCIAQEYEWAWAKSGGGGLPLESEPSGGNYNFNVHFRAEHIEDIAVDEDNNYYFLSKISHGNSHVGGNELTTFGSLTQGSHNILITSFTCEGTYRWSRIIGGGEVTPNRHIRNLILDNNGGIYVSVSLFANTTGANDEPPICFGENNCLPYLTGDNYEVQEGRKSAFLLKYDTDNGDLLWRKDYQGNVNYYNTGSAIFDLQIDGNGVLHTIVGLQDGVHLDGALTVELDEDEALKYYLVKFDSTTGNLIGTPLLLPLELPFLHSVIEKISFRYDETLNRYYLAGWNWGTNSPTVSFNGIDFKDLSLYADSYAYFLSFNPNDLDDWWYIDTMPYNISINAISIDSNSDIYIGGRFSRSGEQVAFFGEHTFGGGSYNGSRPFILKMNSQGEVQWSKVPTGYINFDSTTAAHNSFDVAINGNEVALATYGSSTVWEDFFIDRPGGHQHDPYLIRFNKQNGTILGLHDIYGSPGYSALTAVTADQDGNYVVGGAMRYSLFTDNPNGVPTLYNTSSSGSYTDFFMARLGATPCGVPVFSNEVFHKSQIKLYPNPTSGLVYIETQENIQSYEVYNLLGQRLLSGKSEVINLQDLSNGTYIIKVRTQSGEVMTNKVVKQ